MILQIILTVVPEVIASNRCNASISDACNSLLTVPLWDLPKAYMLFPIS